MREARPNYKMIETQRNQMEVRRMRPASRRVVDPKAIRWRNALTLAVRLVVIDGNSFNAAVAAQDLIHDDEKHFRELLSNKLTFLEPYNSARFSLSEAETVCWIEAGRPR